jgi:hypothetical protein
MKRVLFHFRNGITICRRGTVTVSVTLSLRLLVMMI